MKSIVFSVFCLFVCSQLVFADWYTYTEFETSMTNALYEEERLFRNNDIQQLSAFVPTCSWTNAVLSANLIQAIAFFEQYEEERNMQAYEVSMTALSNLWMHASSTSWHGYCAGIIQSTDYIQKGNEQAGIAIATNLLDRIQDQMPQEPTDEIWRAVRKRLNGKELSVMQSLSFSAAMGFYELGNRQQALLYSENLPEALRKFIFEE